MSMLAERKQKQRWILNGSMHRENDWSKDSNKFGQKMLERMGWKEGKGLGRNEDGLTKHVKAFYKSDTKGMGFKDSVEWSVQQDNFKTLLEELSNSKEESNDGLQNVKSLEEKSQNSRARVHYKKFTRGKDLSRYSEKDLANIFGKKKLNCEGSKDVTVEEKIESEPTIRAGVATIPRGSKVDYFKNKIGFYINGRSSIKDQDDSEEERVSFGFGFNPSCNINTNEENTDLSTKIKKKNKKSKKKEGTFFSYVNDAYSEGKSVFENGGNDKISKKRKSDVLEDESLSNQKAKFEEKIKKKKKSKKINNDVDLQLGVTNPAFEPLGNNIIVEKHVLGTITENEVENELQTPENAENSKKNKKKMKDLAVMEETKNRSQDDEIIQKKKKKKLKGLDNPVLNVSDSVSEIENSRSKLENSLDNSEIKYKKSKKLKNYSNSLGKTESIDSVNVTQNSQTEDVELKSKKKKKKSKGLDNPALNLNDSDASNKVEITPSNCTNMETFEIKNKKKKKSEGIDNPALKLNDSYSKSSEKTNSDCNDNLDGNQTEDFEVKRKKKKNSKGIDNPALNLDDSNLSSEKGLQNGIENSALEISECDIMLNVTDEPVKTTVKQKVEKYTPKQKTKTVRFSKINQEFIIANRSADDITKRNELYDINTKVIEDGLRKLKKQNGQAENHKFDIKSIDKLDFYSDNPLPKKNHLGIDNEGFDIRAQKVEESVNMITQTIDDYQAEVENGINESKIKRVKMHEEYMIGELNCSDGENEPHDEGVKLRFKYAKFNRNEPIWARKNDAQTTLPKKSYKHLIRGDIIVGFKNTNLHEIAGYGMGRSGLRN